MKLTNIPRRRLLLMSTIGVVICLCICSVAAVIGWALYSAAAVGGRAGGPGGTTGGDQSAGGDRGVFSVVNPDGSCKAMPSQLLLDEGKLQSYYIGGNASVVYEAQTPELSMTARLGNDLIGEDVYLLLSLTGKQPQIASSFKRVPQNVTFVVDRSGSMSAEKLESVKQALLSIAGRFIEGDKVAIVSYGSDVKVELASAPFNQQTYENSVRGIVDNGGTNIDSGFRSGLAELTKYLAPGQDNRIILMSDGQANEGISDAEGLANLVSSQLSADKRHLDTIVSTIGVGVDYNEQIMTAMALAGRGNYYFMESPSQAEKIFGQELNAAESTVARQVKVRLELSKELELQGALGYNLSPSALEFWPQDLRAGRTVSYLLKLKVKGMPTAGGLGSKRSLGKVIVDYKNAETESKNAALEVLYSLPSGINPHPLADPTVYREYVQAVNVEYSDRVYCNLQQAKNKDSLLLIAGQQENLYEAQKRFPGEYQQELDSISVKREATLKLKDGENINQTREGNVMLKQNNSEVYDQKYNK